MRISEFASRQFRGRSLYKLPYKLRVSTLISGTTESTVPYGGICPKVIMALIGCRAPKVQPTNHTNRSKRHSEISLPESFPVSATSKMLASPVQVPRFAYSYSIRTLDLPLFYPCTPRGRPADHSPHQIMDLFMIPACSTLLE